MAYSSPSITSSGYSFGQLYSGGVAGILEAVIAANLNASASPTSAPTLSTGGSGNTLPAATYYVVITETDGVGETTASPASTGQAVTLGLYLTVTFPGLKSGNVARNVYVGTSSSGPFTLAASNITASSVNITAPLPANSYAVNPPTTNSTGLTFTDAAGNTTNKALELAHTFDKGDSRRVYQYLASIVRDFLHGDPQNWQAFMQKLRHAHTAFAIMSEVCAEIGTLVDANPGTIKPGAIVGNLFPPMVRTQP